MAGDLSAVDKLVVAEDTSTADEVVASAATLTQTTRATQALLSRATRVLPVKMSAPTSTMENARRPSDAT